MALSRFCTNKLVSQLCLRLPVILLQQSPRPSSCVSKWSPPRVLHTSSMLMSLDEFFPRTSDIIKEGEHAGHSWSASELRQKSNEDLHKLWYVLLKERNMLLTLEQEANRNRYHIPAPERKHKVIKSMARLKFVLHERNMAVLEAKRELGLISAEEIANMTGGLKKKVKNRRRVRKHLASERSEVEATSN